MVRSADFIRLIVQAHTEGWGYIWGRYGQVWTAENQRAATRETTRLYGERWIGHRVADCSGLGYWALRELGWTTYHGSNTMWNSYVTMRSELKDGKRTDGEEMLPGDPVFMCKRENGKLNRYHIGYYIGDGMTIEAANTQKGVVKSPVSKWNETAHWKNMDYEGVIFVKYPTLRKGDSGKDVIELQTLLNELGYNLDVDGKFGDKTKNAVKMFQRSKGLTEDGVVGEQTWDALKKSAGEEPGNTPVQEPDNDISQVAGEYISIPKAHFDELCVLADRILYILRNNTANG